MRWWFAREKEKGKRERDKREGRKKSCVGSS
jgi:hypothetical protein